MALLGFDALGRLALGQIGQAPPPKLVGGGAWEGPVKKAGLSAAIIATTFSSFVPTPATAVVAPPVGGCFTAFSQPAPKVGFSFYEQPQPAFRMFPIAGTPGPLVFTTFSEPRFGPVQQSIETASALFEIRFPPQQTLVFTTFSEPKFSTSYKNVEQPSPLFEERLTPPPPFTSFVNFGLPQQTRYTFANLSWNIDFKIEPTPAIAGGTSKKLLDSGDDGAHRRKRHKTGLEPVKKRPPQPVVEVEIKLPLPPFRDLRAPALDAIEPPVLGRTELPGSFLDLQAQIHAAEDISDVQIFLAQLEQDEQDAADIADVIALLEAEDDDVEDRSV